MQVYSYSVCMLAAVLIGGWLTYREARRRSCLDENTIAVGIIGLAGGVLGAKLSMIVFLGPAAFWRELASIPQHGGAISGGLIGGYAATVTAERFLRVDRCTGDLAAPFLPLGQAIGRLGNLLAGDAYGNPTGLPWGIAMAGATRHPVQVYEMLLDLALFAFLWRKRYTSFRDGELFRLYILGYALIRFPLEFLRYQPTPLHFAGLTLVQWLCIAAFAGFGYSLWRNRRLASGAGLARKVATL